MLYNEILFVTFLSLALFSIFCLLIIFIFSGDN